MMKKNIKNLIFDFGGVLYDIDIMKAVYEFKKIGIDLKEEKKNFPVILAELESGLISDDEFFDIVATMSNKPINKNLILDAFYSVLTGLNKESYSYLLRFRKNYNLFLLSNTSALHYEKFHEEILSNPETVEFYNSFIKEYYSYQLKLRKPDIKIFDYVIKDSGVNPAETVFIDDNPENVEGAIKAGLNGFVFGKETKWDEFIKTFDLIL